MTIFKRVKIVRTVSLNGQLASEGDMARVPEDIARNLVHRGRAVFLEDDAESASEEAPPKKRGRPRKDS